MRISGKRKSKAMLSVIRVNYEKLVASGWVYVVLWECVLRELKGVDKQARLEQLGRLIEQFLASENGHCMEIDANGLHFHTSPES
jgi:G:T-mismatch repair DNA endonuclease (very short patch repair protein)